jgi:hypothetical protein
LQDEALCPLDYEKAGLIVDDDIKKMLVDPLPKGATLYCVFDCCHSGTIIDARFQYDAKTKKMGMNGGESPTAGMVMMISGCMDAQTSADLPPGFDKLIKESVGALSGCLYPMISQKKSWSALVEEVRKKLKTSKLEQIPQLSASRDFDLDGTAFGYAFKDFVPPPPVAIDPTMPAFGIDRAVVVGINYIGTGAALSGCINDAHSALGFLKRNGLKDKPRDSYVLLTEEKGELRPTRKNILKAFHWLTKGSKPGETLWFHFSGHGSQTADAAGDEADGMDETLCPVDYEAAGMITDDDIRAQLVETLPKGVALYVVMDCCHSGTILDLRFGLDAKTKTMTIDDKCKASEPLVVMISGCMDEQESADLPPGFIQGNMDKSVGALSGILYPLLDKKMAWFDLIDKVRKDLKKSKLPQVPQLQASKDLDLSEVAFRRIWSTK